jgi:hypothetical protein
VARDAGDRPGGAGGPEAAEESGDDGGRGNRDEDDRDADEPVEDDEGDGADGDDRDADETDDADGSEGGVKGGEQRRRGRVMVTHRFLRGCGRLVRPLATHHPPLAEIPQEPVGNPSAVDNSVTLPGDRHAPRRLPPTAPPAPPAVRAAPTPGETRPVPV